jgi:RNA polymerase sigma-70 factor (ECF subfamily)
MLAVAAGDLAAFEQIVLRHQAAAWKVAYRFTGDAAEAEDLAQEAFLRILEAAPGYRPAASFRTFLFRVVTRLCLDHVRRKRPIYADSPPAFPDPGGTPLDEAIRRDRDAAVQAALNGLAPNQRMALVLRYFEGLGTVEIAEALGVSSKAAERLLARGRESLEPLLIRHVQP